MPSLPNSLDPGASSADYASAIARLSQLGEALKNACLAGSLSRARRALSEGADPNWLSSAGKTALRLACLRNHLAIACALLDAGADPNHPSDELDPLIIRIARLPDSDCLRSFLRHGADPNARGPKGESPLRSALAQPANVHALLLAGANPLPAQRAPNDLTLLAWCVMLCSRENPWAPSESAGALISAKTLVAAGADPDFPLVDGRTCLQVAIENGSPPEITAYLRSLADQKALAAAIPPAPEPFPVSPSRGLSL